MVLVLVTKRFPKVVTAQRDFISSGSIYVTFLNVFHTSFLILYVFSHVFFPRFSWDPRSLDVTRTDIPPQRRPSRLQCGFAHISRQISQTPGNGLVFPQGFYKAANGSASDHGLLGDSYVYIIYIIFYIFSIICIYNNVHI